MAYTRLYFLCFDHNITVAEAVKKSWDGFRFRRMLHGETLELWRNLKQRCERVEMEAREGKYGSSNGSLPRPRPHAPPPALTGPPLSASRTPSPTAAAPCLENGDQREVQINRSRCSKAASTTTPAPPPAAPASIVGSVSTEPPEPWASPKVGLPQLDPDQADLDSVSLSPPTDRSPAPADVTEVLLGAKSGCTAVVGEKEVELALLLHPAATHGVVPCVQILPCPDVGDGAEVVALVTQSPPGEDAEFVPCTPLTVAEGCTSGAAMMGELAPLATNAAVDCVSSASCFSVPSSCDTAQAVDAQPGEVHAEVLESVRFSEASSGGSSDHEVVAKSSESLLASIGSDPQVMMELALRPLHKLEDSLCLWLARATSLLERAEASVGLQGSLPTTQVALVANHRDQGTEDIGNTMQPLTLGLVAPVAATEISLARSTSDEVQAGAKGCAFAIDEGDTLHDLTELIKCLIAMPAITLGLIRLVKAEQTKHANQVVCAAVRVNSATC
ncbi:hypothetical protein TRIUR3_14928 [Triticum urartu]|uniref:Uncharacterized protein n=1 Tax=Triticum urartu TaxID=4572 RepID=M8A121_TRIUA|nr:hypothetical protein TRIUR3_14928 [Triticum urartu]